MRNTCQLLTAIVAVALLCTSCLHDSDDNSSEYGDMAITAFSLTTVNRYVNTTSSTTGNDTVVKSSVTVSNYPMSIDQVGRTIYNQTPLPAGSDVKHVLCTVSTRNGGVVALKSLTSDSLYYFSSSDSIDFSQPRTLRVFALNGNGSHDYVVTLNVGNSGDTFTWQEVLPATSNRLTASDSISLYATYGSLYAVWKKDGMWTVAQSTDGATWNNRFVTDNWKGATTSKDSLFLMTEEGIVKLWGEGLSESTTTDTTPLTQLVAASTGRLYALGTDGRLKASADGGQTWTDEPLDDSESYLPESGIASLTWVYASAQKNDYVLLIGKSGALTTDAAIWRKIAPWEGGGRWVYMPYDAYSLYKLSRQERLSLARYGSTVVALTDSGTILQSRDQGITWYNISSLQLPTEAAQHAAAIAGQDGETLWLVTTTGQVWQGSLQ